MTNRGVEINRYIQKRCLDVSCPFRVARTEKLVHLGLLSSRAMMDAAPEHDQPRAEWRRCSSSLWQAAMTVVAKYVDGKLPRGHLCDSCAPFFIAWYGAACLAWCGVLPSLPPPTSRPSNRTRTLILRSLSSSWDFYAPRPVSASQRVSATQP